VVHSPPDLSKIPKKQKSYEANTETMKEFYAPKSKETKKQRDSPATDRRDALKKAIHSIPFPEEEMKEGHMWSVRNARDRREKNPRKVTPRYPLGTVGIATEKRRESIRQLGNFQADKATKKQKTKIDKVVRRERQIDNENRILGLAADTGEWDTETKEDETGEGKSRIVVRNQHIAELALLGKVAASAGAATIPKLKASLELTNYCMEKWQIRIDGTETKCKTNPKKTLWKRPDDLVETMKKGWELGTKLDTVVSKHMKRLRADGRGKCFSKCT